MRALDRRQVGVGVGLGVLYGLAQIAQTQGLATTPASVSGFITGTYVVLTPVFTALILREKVAGSTWAAVALATVGLAMLSLNGFSIGVGEAITLLAAALYALHIVGLGRYSASEIAIGLSVVQMVVIAVLCLVGAAPGGIALPNGAGQWASVLYMVVFASILALWAQTWAQAHLPATRAAIIMTVEPVFAALLRRHPRRRVADDAHAARRGSRAHGDVCRRDPGAPTPGRAACRGPPPRGLTHPESR